MLIGRCAQKHIGACIDEDVRKDRIDGCSRFANALGLSCDGLKALCSDPSILEVEADSACFHGGASRLCNISVASF
jgi:hypothetical protein